ncbi:MAG: DUF4418 family protein [Lachnospiraceae bacterium]|nr:DUF4418 family protein [Lachnospiraceae bacterium]
MKKILPSLIPALVWLLLVIGVLTVFSACGMKDDGTWMKCHEAQNAVAVCGGMMAALALLSAFLNKKLLKAALNAVTLAGSIVTFLLPGSLMPMCMMQTMRCFTAMQPFVRIMTVVTALLSIWGIISAIRIRNESR